MAAAIRAENIHSATQPPHIIGRLRVVESAIPSQVVVRVYDLIGELPQTSYIVGLVGGSDKVRWYKPTHRGGTIAKEYESMDELIEVVKQQFREAHP